MDDGFGLRVCGDLFPAVVCWSCYGREVSLSDASTVLRESVNTLGEREGNGGNRPGTRLVASIPCIVVRSCAWIMYLMSIASNWEDPNGIMAA